MSWWGWVAQRLRLSRSTRSHSMLIAVAALAVAFLMVSIVSAQVGRQDTEQQRDATAAQAKTLADQIKTECGSGRLTGPVCATAYEVARDPIPGPEGPRGPAGPPPTPEEIAAAVAEYLRQNPPPAGATGDTGDRGRQGAQGVGVQSVRVEQRDSACLLVFVLFNPADGTVVEQPLPVPGDVCTGPS